MFAQLCEIPFEKHHWLLLQKRQVKKLTNLKRIGFLSNHMTLQGDPNQNLKCLLAITLKQCISDPMLVKPKCV